MDAIFYGYKLENLLVYFMLQCYSFYDDIK